METQGIAYKLKDLPAPIDKILEFEGNGIKYLITITNGVIINNPDGSLELNVYGEAFQILSKALKSNRIFKYKSPIYERQQALDKWDSEIENIVHVTEGHFNGQRS